MHSPVRGGLRAVCGVSARVRVEGHRLVLLTAFLTAATWLSIGSEAAGTSGRSAQGSVSGAGIEALRGQPKGAIERAGVAVRTKSPTGSSGGYKVTFVFKSDVISELVVQWTRACIRVIGTSKRSCQVAADLPVNQNPRDSCPSSKVSRGDAKTGSVTFCNVLTAGGRRVGAVELTSVSLRSRYCARVRAIGLPVKNTGVGDDVVTNVKGFGVTTVRVDCR